MLQNGFLKTVNGVFIVGVRVEGKGMKTKADKKLSNRNKTGQFQSTCYYTGKVQTTVKNSYITVPVSAVYRCQTNGISMVDFISQD
jgi:hypothetical protein